MKFIDIVSTGEDKRTSTLMVTSTGLRVIGNLPHGYEFKLKTARDKKRMAEWVKYQGKGGV